MDSAEAAKESLGSRSLDEDALGHLEEDIRAVGTMLGGQPAKVIHFLRVLCFNEIDVRY